MNERIKYLTDLYLAGKCTPEEAEELEAWYESLGQGKPDKLVIGTVEANDRLEALFSKIQHSISQPPQTRSGKIFRPVFWRWAVAAILVATFAVIYFTANKKRTEVPQLFATDAHPGGNHATLKLSDGKIIYLDSVQNGQLASQSGMQIIKLDSGSLAYKGNAQEVSYNTLATPKGGQYHIVLPDGSKVWLNAGSSLRFPTAFKGKNREVNMTGEAYFEVAHNAGQPFVVKASNVAV